MHEPRRDSISGPAREIVPPESGRPALARRAAGVFRKRCTVLIAALLIMSFLGMGEACSHAPIQRRTDPESGVVTYVYLPAPVPPRIKPDSSPRRTASAAAKAAPPQSKAKQPGMPALAIPETPPAPGDFPRVSAHVQKTRDTQRRRILLQELAAEEEKLAHALASDAESGALHRYRANIEALQREIQRTR